MKCYKGNWATIEIMKTLLKNRRSYKTRIGLPDMQDNKDIGGESPEEEKGEDQDWDDMYMKDNEERDEDGGEDGDGNSGEGDGGEDGDGNSGEGNGDEIGHEDDEEVGAEDKGGRKGEGSSSAKQAGKRKVTQDDAPATTRFRKKINVSKAPQVATQPTKKAAPKGKQSRK